MTNIVIIKSLINHFLHKTTKSITNIEVVTAALNEDNTKSTIIKESSRTIKINLNSPSPTSIFMLVQIKVKEEIPPHFENLQQHPQPNSLIWRVKSPLKQYHAAVCYLDCQELLLPLVT